MSLVEDRGFGVRRRRWKQRKVLGGPPASRDREPHIPELTDAEIEAALRAARRAQARLISAGADRY